MESDFTVSGTVEALNKTLRSYLEAQYHIRDESLIADRQLLLEKDGVIHQTPYVESTPSYKKIDGYDNLTIPNTARDVLNFGASLKYPSIGIFDKPYTHQGSALQEFLSIDKNLIVATGTGSGKTETFLMPLLGQLSLENEISGTAKMPGCRALILYPMNALVNDQLGRIRRIFGDPRMASRLDSLRGRRVLFGSYTGRTPYPGRRDSLRDQKYLDPIFQNFYMPKVKDEELVKTLKSKGRWPSKDLVSFFGADKIVEGKRNEEGKVEKNTQYNRKLRYKTSASDSELMTRDEMQILTPDILITNYSMLEYMLIRPIEKKIFDDTQQWLASNSKNKLLIILDEAHMYRGTGGAEVAYLIRRLLARLRVGSDRAKFILTSASLGSKPEDISGIKKFASLLTGEKDEDKFSVITGEKEERQIQKKLIDSHVKALCDFDIDSFYSMSVGKEKAVNSLKNLSKALGWPTISSDDNKSLKNYLYENLNGWEPAERLVQLISGKATKLNGIEKDIFPKLDKIDANKALETLLAISSFAMRSYDEKVFLPTRVHLFYRGLPGLYLCLDTNCTERKENPLSSPLGGKLYTEPLVNCHCASKGRVYELLTHRDCGAAFIRGFSKGSDLSFLWHEPTNLVGANHNEKLLEFHLLIDGVPHANAMASCALNWINISTGQLQSSEVSPGEGFRKVFAPTSAMNKNGRKIMSFNSCPVCLKEMKQVKIMDLVTKGEAPFANLVKTQLASQPPKIAESAEYPNGGRKVLLFSDGRQKAARLARDIPREVELDSFRQTIVLAANELEKLSKEPFLNKQLYKAFIDRVSHFNLNFFDGRSQKTLSQHVRQYKREFVGDLAEAFANDWDPGTEPPAFNEALLRQLASEYYSVQSATIGYVKVIKRVFRNISEKISKEMGKDSIFIEAAIDFWIENLLLQYAFNRDISKTSREKVSGYPVESVDPKIGRSKKHREFVRNYLGVSEAEITKLESILSEFLCHDGYLIPANLKLVTAVNSSWYQCGMCTNVTHFHLNNKCPNCGAPHLKELRPDESEYLRARKSFWRLPVVNALKGLTHPRHISVEEHTAQLSQRDPGVVHATTEQYELRFQDMLINENDTPIDVLSSTTTMEVGIDIGSLVAVGLRNVPPQRENYQQRAGRAGRRGSSVSTVITYGQGGPHDSYYFNSPEAIVSGPPRSPSIKVDNEKIAKRHVYAYLLQSFFREQISNHPEIVKAGGSEIMSTLGKTRQFFFGDSPASFSEFRNWVFKKVKDEEKSLIGWLPDGIFEDLPRWLSDISTELVEKLELMQKKFLDRYGKDPIERDGEDDESDLLENGMDEEQLLKFLFNEGVLPTYAFPTNLCSFSVERLDYKNGLSKVVNIEKPQNSIMKGLSEYAPGRLVVIDKVTYRSGGVTASVLPTEVNRAEKMFLRKKTYVFCEKCTYVQDPEEQNEITVQCPVCSGNLLKKQMVQPETFYPRFAAPLDETDRDQEFTYATSAQFPKPTEEHYFDWNQIGEFSRYAHAKNCRLVTVNKGDAETNEGFHVCTKCGDAVLADSQKSLGAHFRPYKIEPRRGKPFATPKCDGSYEKVFLGAWFNSDLLLIRIDIKDPLAVNMNDPVTDAVLNASLRTLAEGLVLAASRHPNIDVDANEFSSGYRIIKNDETGSLWADLYLYDNLSGGAGYSDIAGENIHDILVNLKTILSECPSNCDSSCYQCLRHYSNQIYHHSLDRFHALEILEYMLNGTIPKPKSVKTQIDELSGLAKMLNLAGYRLESEASRKDVSIPLLVKTKAGELAIGTTSALVNANSVEHPLHALDTTDVGFFPIESFLLKKNLPLAFTKILEQLGE